MNVLLTQKKIISLLVGAFVLFVALALNTNFALAAANQQINYQGKLTNASGVAVPDGTYNMRFWLLTTPSIATTSAVWTESLTASDTKVQVTNGLFSVMLGSSTPLTGVDWNQTLYLGVEIGGTSTPAWDGEMSPRKILGTVPAAFVANYANTSGAASSSDSLSGIASSSFLRSDEADTMEATSTSPLLSLIQRGTGKLLSIFRGLTEVFTIANNGNVGVGTSTPSSLFSVQGTSGSTTPLFTVASSTGTALMAILSNGNVGIGTDSAGERLEVVGNIISKGTEWTLRTSTTTNTWQSVAYGNGKFVAVGNDGSGNDVMISPDGVTWTPVSTASAGYNQWSSVTYGNGLFVAVPAAGVSASVMTSPDGVTWTNRTSAEDTQWTSVTYGNGLFVAVSNSGTYRVMTSPDGITWTGRSAVTASWTSVTYGNGLFVAVSGLTNGLVMTSPDGINWTSRTAATATYWRSVTYGNGLFVAVASTGSGNRVMTSVDGINWTSRTSAADNAWQSVTYGNGLFVAVSSDGSGNRVMTSPDGINWKTRSTSGIDKSYRSIVYANGVFVSVAGSNSGADVMTSGKADYSVLATNNIYQGGTSFFGGLRAGTTTSSIASVFLQSQAGINPFAIASSTGASLLTLTQAGYLGIGTSTPEFPLDVIGSGQVFRASQNNGSGQAVFALSRFNHASQNNEWSYNISNGGGNVANGSLLISPTGGATTSDLGFAGSSGGYSTGGQLIIKGATGNVGIGTTSPSSRLTVAGDTYIGGSLSVLGAFKDSSNASGTSGYVLQTTGSGTQWVATSSLGFSSSFTNSAQLAALLSDETGTGLSVFNTSPIFNTQITTPSITSTTTLSIDSAAAAALSIGTGASAKTITLGNITGATAINFNTGTGGSTFTTTNGTFNLQTGTGAINLGTAATAKTITLGNSTGATAINLNTGTGSSLNLGTNAVAHTITMGNVTGATGLVFNSGTAGSIFATGNVGIGTTTNSTNSAKLSIQSSFGSTNALFDIATTTSSGFATSSLFRVNANGNVGIGTTTPSSKLTVAGDTYIGGSISVSGAFKDSTNASGTAGYVLQTTGSGTQWVATSSLGITGGSGVSGGAVGFATRFLSATTLGTSTLLDNGTVAGINATSSSYSFNVQGKSGINPFRIASSTGTALLAVLNNGNVGIGTETAGERLEVVGNIISKGTEWTLRQSTTTNTWQSVTYGNGLFVAVSSSGSGNRVMTSPDGITWTSRTSAADNTWQSVTYGNGLFVAVSNDGSGNRVMTSPDGITWTSRTSAADNAWTSVTYGNGLFVAVSSGGTDRVMTSPDGITWTSRTAATASVWQSVTYGNGLFVAVGGTGAVMTSSDGISWVSRTAASTKDWYDVTYGNGLFVAVSSSFSGSTAMISSDGITWTAQTPPLGGGWAAVTYGNGLFVAGSASSLVTSPDGVNWVARTPYQSTASLTYGNGVFVAVGGFGNGFNVMTSGKSDYSVLATNNIYQGGMSVFGNFRVGSSTNSNPFSIASTTGSNLFSITNRGRAVFGTTSSANIFLNGGSATVNVVNSNSIAIGNEALTYTSSTSTTLNNIAFGYQALYGSSTELMTGRYNFAAGYQAGFSNTTGSNNTFIGDSVGLSNTTGSHNSFIGAGAGANNTTGSSNSFIGFQSGLNNTTGSYNSFIGYTAGNSNDTGTNNSFIGYSTGLNNTSGSYNSFIGYQAGYTNTTGFDNIALGQRSLRQNSTGNSNIALGTSTLYNTTGSNNIGLGAFAGYTNTSGNSNLYLGAFADASAGTYSTSTAIGAGAIVGRSNALILGGTGNSYVNVGIGTTTPSATLTIRGTAGNNLLDIASSTGANLLSLSQKGALGIGTSSPSSNLSVVGNINDNFNRGLTNVLSIIGGGDIGNGQGILLQAGSGQNQGGGVTINAGLNSLSGGLGGSLNLSAGAGASFGEGGAVNISAGSGGDLGGNIVLNPGSGGTSNGFILLGTTIGNVGIGTTTPSNKLTVAGDTYIAGSLRVSGAFKDSSNASGTSGYVLQTTGSGTQWVATSSLGITGGAGVTGGEVGYATRFLSATTLGTSTLLDNGTVAGINATSSSYSFNVQGRSGIDPFSVASSTGIPLFIINSKGAVGIGYDPASETVNSLTVSNYIKSKLGFQLYSSYDSTNVVDFTETSGYMGLAYDKKFEYGAAGIGFFGATPVAKPSSTTDLRQALINLGLYTTGGATPLNLNGGKLTSGSLSLSGAFLDSTSATGTLGQVLLSTGTSTQWVATSSLGITGGSGVSGGAVGFATRFLSATTLGTSTLLDNGTVAGINATSSSYSFNVQGASGINPFRVASSTGTALLAILNNGNVGIGTETAGEKLEVVGNIISKGTEWTLRTSTTTNAWKSVTYGNGLFVAVSNTGSGNRVMTSPDGINWTSRTSAANNNWQSVAYGNGLFVAVASDGVLNNVMTSTDGVVWILRTSAANNTWNSVTYGNGLFVAVSSSGSGNRVMTSPDGITWTSRSSAANNNWQSVAYGNGLFVAVGYAIGPFGRVMTSTDGITWTSRTAAADNTWQSITYGNGLFVAVSLDGSGNRVMTSPDGINWTSRNSAANNSWNSVTYGNGIFVAVSYDGSGNRVMTSPDGITWKTRSTSGIDKTYYGVTYGNGTFVAVADSSSGSDVMTSGKADHSVLAHNNIYQGGTSFFGGLRAGTTTASIASIFLQGQAGINPFAIASSTGTSLLTLTQAGNLGLGTTTPDSLLTVAGSANVTGQTTLTTASSTALTATTLYSNLARLTNASSSNLSLSGYLYDSVSSAGTSGQVLWSTGTSTLWVATSSLGLSSSGVSGGAAGYAARFLSENTLGTSTLLDNGLVAGINATSSSYSFNVQGKAGVNPFNVSSSTGTSLLAVLNNGNLELPGQLISAGVNWTSRNVPDAKGWYSVTYGNGLFVAVNYNNSATGSVMTSPDGITWTSRNVPDAKFWRSVTYGNGLFVAVNNNGSATGAVMTSPDGLTWTSRNVPDAKWWYAITYGNGLFVAVNENSSATGAVMTSPDGITWTSRNVPDAKQWRSVTYGNGLFVAVNGNSSATGAVMTSPDGLTWTSRNVPDVKQWRSVTYGNGLFVAVNYNNSATGAVMTSPDGITWTSRNVPDAKWWQSVTYGNGLFVAVNENGFATGAVMTSGFTSKTELAHNNIYQGGMSVFGNFRVGSSTNNNPFSVASTTGSNLFSITNYGRAVFGTSTSANIFLNGGSATANVANSNSIAIGNEALTYTSTTSSSLRNIALGPRSLYGSSTALMTGSDNIAVGYQAGYSNTTGSNNSFIGYSAGYSNTTGSYNVFTGFGAGSANTTGSYNSFTGYQVGSANTTGSYNSFTGYWAGYNNTTGSNNSFIGTQAGYNNTTGSNNSFIGYFAGLVNTTGSDNLALGAESLYSNSTGNANIAFGTSTLYNTTGSNNIGLGNRAGYNNTTGNNNTFLGAFANATAGTYSSSTAIGAGAIVGRSNALVLGGTGNSYVNVGIGTTTPASTLTIRGTAGNNPLNIASSTGASLLTLFQDGNLGLSTTTSNGRINMERLGFTGNGTVAGINQYLTFANGTASAVQYANQTYLSTTNTATTTLVGNIIRLADSTTFGNTVRGFEVQTERGNNTLGENTAISGFARTFGVRGVTEGDAGGTFEPAGVYGETRGATQGNAIRGYSSTITTSSLLKLFQDSSEFIGTGLLMNFGNSSGSFSSTTASRFIDLKNAGTSMFTVGAYGMLTIGDGTTSNNAGLQIGYGGICVDNDGTCTASTTGRITSVSSATGNSDLAETYFSDENLIPGEIVYLKSGLSIGRADTNTKSQVLGVVSTLPGLLMGQDDVSLNSGEEGYPIALAGRVPVRLSNENGDIKAGDELMLSSIPGVAMKASSTGMVVGRALEDFTPTRAYSDTYINQFGESLIVPEYTPIDRVNDPRLDDGCYYGGGNASGEEACVPLVSTTTAERYDEADALALKAAKEAALRALKRVPSTELNINGTDTVQVGQIVMFVDLRYRYLDEAGEAMLSALLATASTTGGNSAVTETIWQRLVNLANNFIDGVLRVLTLKADRVETNQLCVDGVCINANDLRQMLNSGVPVSPPSNNGEDVGGDDGEGGEEEVVPDPSATTSDPVTDTPDTTSTSTTSESGQTGVSAGSEAGNGETVTEPTTGGTTGTGGAEAGGLPEAPPVVGAEGSGTTGPGGAGSEQAGGTTSGSGPGTAETGVSTP